MKKSKFLSISAILLLSASLLSAVEFGAIVGNSTKFSLNENKTDKSILEQTNTLNASIKVPFNNEGSAYFTAEALAKNIFTKDFDEDTTNNHFSLDLPLLKISALKKLNSSEMMIFDAGRFFIADSTGISIAQIFDGASFRYISPKFKASANAGWTGLLNTANTTILKSIGETFISEKENPIYEMNLPYVLASASVELPYLVFNQNLALELIAAIPTDKDEDDVSRYYATLGISGPLSAIVFYNVATTFETKDFDDAANLSLLELSVFPAKFPMSISAKGIYASGEQGGLKPFVPFTQSTAFYSKDEPFYSSIIKTGLEATFKPANKFECSVGSDVIFDSYEEKSFSYNGTQIFANFVFQAFSDLSLNLKAISYFAEQTEESKTQFVFNFSLAF